MYVEPPFFTLKKNKSDDFWYERFISPSGSSLIIKYYMQTQLFKNLEKIWDSKTPRKPFKAAETIKVEKKTDKTVSSLISYINSALISW